MVRIDKTGIGRKPIFGDEEGKGDMGGIVVEVCAVVVVALTGPRGGNCTLARETVALVEGIGVIVS
jgi:hypothetical protein